MYLPAIISEWMENGLFYTPLSHVKKLYIWIVGTANQYLKSNPQISRESIIIDIALGMEYLHGASHTPSMAEQPTPSLNW
jgi:hypothetical protein